MTETEGSATAPRAVPGASTDAQTAKACGSSGIAAFLADCLPRAFTSWRQQAVERGDAEAAEALAEVTRDQIEGLARRGAREILMTALKEEVDAYLGEACQQQDGHFRPYGNGTFPPRGLVQRSSAIDQTAQCVANIPLGLEAFEAKILRDYLR